MHLKIQKRNGRQYLSVVQSYRLNGAVKSRTVETIGYADDYADQYDDPIAHFREYVAALNARDAIGEKPIELCFDRDEVITPDAAPTARLGAAVALGYLDAIGISDFFRARAGQPGFSAHAGRVFEMLACERMMHATSKREAWTARASFPRACDFSFENVYAALPYIARKRAELDAFQSRHLRTIAKLPDPDRIFLVCGSYAFPVDGGSMRASIAVALDRIGMPLGYHDMQGRLDPSAFREATDVLKARLGARKAVVIAGGLRDPQPTIEELASTADGFIVYQRDVTNRAELATWANDENGYTPMPGGVLIKQRQTSRKTSSGSNVPVKEVALKGGGYAVRSSQAVLVSSELDMNAASIVNSYRELWRQAEPFQPLEADFSSVPFPTAADDHIHAHFAICYAAFSALRLLRWKMGWKHNAAETADALMRMEGAHVQRNYYLFSYRDITTDDIESAAGIPVAHRLRTRADLRHIPATTRAALTG